MIKKFITSFLIISAFAAQSFAQDNIYVWEKSGAVTGFKIADIDSFAFTAPELNAPEIVLRGSVFHLGHPIVGSISSDRSLQIATLELNGKTVTGWPVTDFSLTSPIYGKSGSYFILITGLAPGNYQLSATDNEGHIRAISFLVRESVTSFEAVAGDVYYYEHDGVMMGTFTVTEVSADGTGYKVVVDNGTSSAAISWTGNSFLLKDFATTLSGTNIPSQSENLLFYLVGQTTTVNAGQLAIFSMDPNRAKITRFSKQ